MTRQINCDAIFRELFQLTERVKQLDYKITRASGIRKDMIIQRKRQLERMRTDLKMIAKLHSGFMQNQSSLLQL